MIDETIYILTKLKISNGFEPLKKKKKIIQLLVNFI